MLPYFVTPCLSPSIESSLHVKSHSLLPTFPVFLWLVGTRWCNRAVNMTKLFWNVSSSRVRHINLKINNKFSIWHQTNHLVISVFLLKQGWCMMNEIINTGETVFVLSEKDKNNCYPSINDFIQSWNMFFWLLQGSKCRFKLLHMRALLNQHQAVRKTHYYTRLSSSLEPPICSSVLTLRLLSLLALGGRPHWALNGGDRGGEVEERAVRWTDGQGWFILPRYHSILVPIHSIYTRGKKSASVNRRCEWRLF